MTNSDHHFRQFHTTSGSPLWHCFRPGANGITLEAVILAGTRDEQWPEQAGLAHALEHMFFQGTEKFPSSEAIDAHVEDVGGSINWGTSKEMMYFEITIPVEHARRGVEMLSQLMLAPTFPKNKIASEKQVILHEIQDLNDSPRHCTERIYDDLVYGSHPLGRDILGTKTSVAAFQQEDFIAFKNRSYNSNNMVFTSAGGIDGEEVARLFDEYFPRLPTMAIKIASVFCPARGAVNVP